MENTTINDISQINANGMKIAKQEWTVWTDQCAIVTGRTKVLR